VKALLYRRDLKAVKRKSKPSDLESGFSIIQYFHARG